jgi:hypothetical protein
MDAKKRRSFPQEVSLLSGTARAEVPYMNCIRKARATVTLNEMIVHKSGTPEEALTILSLVEIQDQHREGSSSKNQNT